jgi:hypothetical protein
MLTDDMDYARSFYEISTRDYEVIMSNNGAAFLLNKEHERKQGFFAGNIIGAPITCLSSLSINFNNVFERRV